jgi:hypothetical protein
VSYFLDSYSHFKANRDSPGVDVLKFNALAELPIDVLIGVLRIDAELGTYLYSLLFLLSWEKITVD